MGPLGIHLVDSLLSQKNETVTLGILFIDPEGC